LIQCWSRCGTIVVIPGNSGCLGVCTDCSLLWQLSWVSGSTYRPSAGAGAALLSSSRLLAYLHWLQPAVALIVGFRQHSPTQCCSRCDRTVVIPAVRGFALAAACCATYRWVQAALICTHRPSAKAGATGLSSYLLFESLKLCSQWHWLQPAVALTVGFRRRSLIQCWSRCGSHIKSESEHLIIPQVLVACAPLAACCGVPPRTLLEQTLGSMLLAQPAPPSTVTPMNNSLANFLEACHSCATGKSTLQAAAKFAV
jgi:hypothetical protein